MLREGTDVDLQCRGSFSRADKECAKNLLWYLYVIDQRAVAPIGYLERRDGRSALRYWDVRSGVVALDLLQWLEAYGEADEDGAP